MKKQTHDHFQVVIADMMKSTHNDTKNHIELHRDCILAAQWAEFHYAMNTFRNEQRIHIKKDPYHFWVTTEKRRLVLMSVIVAYYRDIPLVIAKVANDLGFSTKTVSTVLNEARGLALLETKNDCKFKPSHDTIDGYVYYTNKVMKLEGMQRLSASVLRDLVGSFNKPNMTKMDDARVDFRR